MSTQPNPFSFEKSRLHRGLGDLGALPYDVRVRIYEMCYMPTAVDVGRAIRGLATQFTVFAELTASGPDLSLYQCSVILEIETQMVVKKAIEQHGSLFHLKLTINLGNSNSIIRHYHVTGPAINTIHWPLCSAVEVKFDLPSAVTYFSKLTMQDIAERSYSEFQVIYVPQYDNRTPTYPIILHIPADYNYCNLPYVISFGNGDHLTLRKVPTFFGVKALEELKRSHGVPKVCNDSLHECHWASEMVSSIKWAEEADPFDPHFDIEPVEEWEYLQWPAWLRQVDQPNNINCPKAGTILKGSHGWWCIFSKLFCTEKSESVQCLLTFDQIDTQAADAVLEAVEKRLENRSPRVSYNSLHKELTFVLMPSNIYDAHQPWVTRSLAKMIMAGKIDFDDFERLRISSGTAGQRLPTVVIESGWSEGRSLLKEDHDLWLYGGVGSVQNDLRGKSRLAVWLLQVVLHANRFRFAPERTSIRHRRRNLAGLWKKVETSEKRKELPPILMEMIDEEDEAWKLMPLYVSWKKRRERHEQQATVIVPPYPPWSVDLSQAYQPGFDPEYVTIDSTEEDGEQTTSILPSEGPVRDAWISAKMWLPTLDVSMFKRTGLANNWDIQMGEILQSDLGGRMDEQDDVEIPLDLTDPSAVASVWCISRLHN
ncbi:hypothetical protein B7463_g1383, partial [Scytalidium lignicola]